ncbi:haloacid dehalogenase type II [Mucilaginibacter sp. X4EP1]|uniref:haloacid dehalogenase type II n=1 Tax=Mucilaginibacter sp. X4EP1 TaxID=2723092 RepID=UPI0021690776|nr:haloacid dehalogenase type II [Mucilaginibacter sp. X4EP1]MCS3813434.1 2-haloacid dehalogenase [Mucilaginibacter sp. X4EP1]
MTNEEYMDRREFLAVGGALTAAVYLHTAIKDNFPSSSIKAIIFDGFPIFDARPVFKIAAQLFPEKSDELIKEWRIRQFEYTWLRSLAGNYQDFFKVTEDALIFAGTLLGIGISELQRKKLMEAYYHLQVWQEVPTALSRLKSAGLRLGILSNYTPEMLLVNATNNQIDHYFEHMISVDQLKKYKPDPATYALGMSAFSLAKEEILFVPFAGWDLAGAKIFGYQTFWVNGMQMPLEQLGAIPDGIGKNLNDLLAYLNI